VALIFDLLTSKPSVGGFHQHRSQILRQGTPTTSVRRRRLTATVSETQASQYEMQPITLSSNARAAVDASASAASPPCQHGSLASSSGGRRDPSTRATAMLTTVVGVFLLVEVPLPDPKYSTMTDSETPQRDEIQTW